MLGDGISLNWCHRLETHIHPIEEIQMSSTVHAPKINTVRTLNDRNLMSLFVLAALIVTLVVSFTYAADRPAAESINYEAYMIHRQGEWLSVPIPVDNAEAYRIFRRGEVS